MIYEKLMNNSKNSILYFAELWILIISCLTGFYAWICTTHISYRFSLFIMLTYICKIKIQFGFIWTRIMYIQTNYSQLELCIIDFTSYYVYLLLNHK
jgi:hypothetical protein